MSLELNTKERVLLLGLLKDAFGYPYSEYLPGVEEQKDEFNRLYKELQQPGSLIKDEDRSLAILAARQAYEFMGQDTLNELHDDVAAQELPDLLKKLES